MSVVYTEEEPTSEEISMHIFAGFDYNYKIAESGHMIYIEDVQYLQIISQYLCIAGIPTDEIRAKKLYKLFTSYCIINNHMVLDKPDFARHMHQLGYNLTYDADIGGPIYCYANVL
jgi:hypothetical protein